MGRWLALVFLAVAVAGCTLVPTPNPKPEYKKYTPTWGEGFSCVALAYTDKGPIPIPDEVPDATCPCKGSGRIVQPDGHETDCPGGGPGVCPLTKRGNWNHNISDWDEVAAVERAARKTELEWCRLLAAEMGCDQATGIEQRIATGTRVDLMNDQWAIEVDWASKWAEGCGQALYYGICTGRQPGLLLLLREPADRRYVDRAAVVAGKHGIGLWAYDTASERWLVMFKRGVTNGAGNN